MAFWKKHEDPWEIDPEKRRREAVPVFEQEPETEEAPAEKKWPWQKKKEPEEVPPETCPWCGRPMERAYLYSGRDKLRLCSEKPSAFWGAMGADTVELCDEGFWVTHKSCWQCKSCRKVVADFPEPEEYGAEEGLPDWTAVPVRRFDGEEPKRQED